MSDLRLRKFAQIMVDHSTRVQPGDRVAVNATTAAEPVLLPLYELILERGGYPHLLIDLPAQEEILFAHASDEQLEFVPIFHQAAFDQFDVLIKIRSELNTRGLSGVASERLSHRQKAIANLISTQMRRGAEGSLRWLSTQYPTPAYAMEAEMGIEEYSDFFFRACHADEGTPDPVAHWQGIEREQQRIIVAVQGRNKVAVRGPHADLTLSVQGRTFKNACGQNNLPDGEIFTGPVEDSVNGWVRYSYPAIYQGRVVEGIELQFEDGRVVNATAAKNQDVLLAMLDIDAGARYVGEFAIGTNFEINRFTHSTLLDEKIGGSFHMALGAGYPETGSQNKSQIHWDMICDLRQDSEITVDGEIFYRDGQFII